MGWMVLAAISFAVMNALAKSLKQATFGQLSITRAYALDKAARVGAAGWLQVLFALGLEGLFFKHLPDAWAMSGIALLVLAGVLLVLDAKGPSSTRGHRRTRATHAPKDPPRESTQ